MVVRLLKQYILLLGVLLFNSFLTSCFEEEEEDVPTVDDEVLHKFVDLGLPSGLKWATVNVEALKPEEYGGYYAWGEVTEKDHYIWGSSTLENSSLSVLNGSGYVDSLGDLSPTYDAASVNWGPEWRMPTELEFKELVDYCDWKWVSINGVQGYTVSSKAKDNTNSIFLPAGGHVTDKSVKEENESGYYWCSNVSDDWSMYSTTFNFGSDKKKFGKICMRYHGQSVRPVRK